MKTFTKSFRLALLLLMLPAPLGACKASVSRNDNGSLDLDTRITQLELQEAVTAAIADPLVKNVTVSLQSGYVLVSGERSRLNDPKRSDTLSFRLDLGASNRQLASSISDATLDGRALDQARVDHWNQTIAKRLSNLGKKT